MRTHQTPQAVSFERELDLYLPRLRVGADTSVVYIYVAPVHREMIWRARRSLLQSYLGGPWSLTEMVRNMTGSLHLSLNLSR